MKNIVLVLIFGISTFFSNAQESFYKTYPFYNFTEKSMVFAWEDGYSIAVLAVKDTFCLSIIRTNLEGDTLWTIDYDISFYSTEANLRGTSDGEGNIYLSLTRTNKNLLKIDQNGSIVWFKDYPFLQHVIKYGNDFLWAITYPGGKREENYFSVCLLLRLLTKSVTSGMSSLEIESNILINISISSFGNFFDNLSKTVSIY